MCNANLNTDEIIIVKLPYGDFDSKPGELCLLKNTIYGLQHSPKYWYNMVMGILKDMGLTASLHDPCLFTGITNNDSAPKTARKPVYISLYVKYFLFLSESGTEEERLQQLLSDRLKVDFMG